MQQDGLHTLPVLLLLDPPIKDSSTLPPLEVSDHFRLQHPLFRKWDEKGILNLFEKEHSLMLSKGAIVTPLLEAVVW